MKRLRVSTLFLIFLFLLVIWADLPSRYPIKFNLGPLKVDRVTTSPVIDFNFLGNPVHKEFETKLGLDLRGGSSLLFEADLSKIPDADKEDALIAARDIIERRVNSSGVSEPNVQTIKSGKSQRISVELPGVENVEEAVSLIGTTAQLEFKEYDEAAASEAAALNVLQGASDSADLLQQQQQDFMTFLASFKPSGLDGSHVKKATVQFSSGSAKDVGPSVQLVFDKEGAKLFEDITGRNIGKPLGIFIDGMPITQPPTVQQKIIGGEAVITGNFTVDEAKKLAISINSGALPIPVTLIQQSNIGPTLGKESVQKSIMAGAVGLSAVILFMILYYGRLGLIATVGLLIYALISYAIVRSIPIVLTLPGIAGFILSVGMAVDANILIFERIKEEQRKGKVFAQAVQLGFGKAMDAIKDANIATIMVAFILYNPLNWEFFPQFGLIRGFALTLFIGVVTSLFTGIVITKRLIEAFYTGAPITKKSKQS